MSTLSQNIFKWFFRTLIIAFLLWYFVYDVWFNKEASAETTISSITAEIETLGKLELVKYNTQEVTELKDPSKIFNFLQGILPPNKAILISKGEAVGCLDLQKIGKEAVRIQGDTVYVELPEPELCYFKVDLENSRIYEMETALMTPEQEGRFVKMLYQQAESQVRSSALNSGILEQTRANAELILKPLLENVSGKTVIFTSKPPPSIIDLF